MDAIGNKRADSFSHFGQEFAYYWKQLPNRTIFFALLVAWCLLFHFLGVSSFNFTDTPSLFEWMYGAWNAPALDSSQGNLITPAVLILIWIRRKELAAAVGPMWWPGLIFLGVALVLHILGFLVQQPRLSIVALFLGLYSLVGLMWGWREMKASFFPFLLFAFCMPFGTFIENLTLPLRLMSTTLTYWICHILLGIPVLQQGTTLYSATGLFNYDVAAACSGIRSFFALLALTIVFSMLVFKSSWRRALMIFLTVPLVVFCNVLRLTGIVLGTQAWGNQAGLLIHEWFGFLTYAVAIVCLMVAAHWLREKPLRPAT